MKDNIYVLIPKGMINTYADKFFCLMMSVYTLYLTRIIRSDGSKEDMF